MNTTAAPELGEEEKAAREFMAPTTGYAPEAPKLPDLPASSELIEKVGQPWQEGSPEITWDQICLVRALSSEDQLQVVDSDGKQEVIAPTLVNVTKGELARHTIHWSLNHRVEGHLQGSWEGSPLILVAPGAETVKENGKPINLAGYDTYWDHDIKLPENSVVVYAGEKPAVLSKLKSIKTIEAPVDADLAKQAEQLSAEVHNLYEQMPSIKSYEDRKTMEAQIIKTQDQLNSITGSMDAQVQQVVNKEMERMGYTEFTFDTGTYMGMPGLDNAIGNLCRREGIETGPHAYTATHGIEKASLILNIPPSELFKVNERNFTEFELVMKTVKSTLDGLVDYPENLPQEAINVLSGDIYHVLHENPEEVKKDIDGTVALMELFESQPQIFNSIVEWSKNTKEENNPVEQFVKIKNILDLGPDQEQVAKFENGDIETLTLTRQVPEELQDIIGPLLQSKFDGMWENISDVKSEVLNKNNDGTAEMQFSVNW